MQDSKGFMWFGTKDGLNRFDGYSFKTFRHNDADSTSIGNNSITKLYEGNDGIIWIGTERGLYFYDPQYETFKIISNGPLSEIRSIASDNEYLWFIAGFTLFKYPLSNRKPQSPQKVKNIDICTTVTSSQTGEIWIGTLYGTIARYNRNKDSFQFYSVFEHSKPAVSNWIEKVYDSGAGFLLIGTSNQGVKKFDLNTNNYTDLLTYGTDNTDIYARDFIKYADNEYWIATESGIYIYNTTKSNFINLKKDKNNPYALSENAVYSFTKDQQGGIWASTYFGGVNYLPKQNLVFEKYFYNPTVNSLQGNAIREIKSDNRGNLWIGTEDAGLNKYNLNTGSFTNYHPTQFVNSIAHSNIHGLLVDDDKLWIGTFEHGLDVMDLKTEAIIKHYNAGPQLTSLKSNFIYTIYKTSDKQIYIGTSNGIYTYNRQYDNFKQLSFFPPNIFFSAICEDNKGNIWVGTFKHGVYYYNPLLNIYGRLTISVNGRNKLIDNRITNIYIDSKNYLWICTEENLFRINTEDKSVKQFSTQNGLPGNLVYSVIEDNNNNLWITTSRGLAMLNRRTSNITVYTQTNGLLSDQFNYSSAYKDSIGQIYFGSVNGLIRFDPSKAQFPIFSPHIYITNLQISNTDIAIKPGSTLAQSLLYTKKIILKHNESSISIDFAALDYISPQNIKYRYKLEGLDDDWNYIKTNRRVYFTDLSPGKYKFLIRSTDNNGKWANNERALFIEILPPWWKSNWAYVVYTVLILLIIYGIILFYHNRQLEKQRRRMDAFERAKEKEMYETKIDFFTQVAHEIRTPLTLIKAPMEKLIKNIHQTPQSEKYLLVMNKNTERLLDLTNQLLDFRKIESGNVLLNKKEIDIVSLIKNISINFQPLAESKNILIKMSAPATLIYQCDEEALIKIISNLLDNAIKYGHSLVHININKEEEIKINIANDGVLIPTDLMEKIFDPFFRLKDKEKTTGTGIGLPLARSLAELHGGSLSLTVSGKMNIFVLTLPGNNH